MITVTLLLAGITVSLDYPQYNGLEDVGSIEVCAAVIPDGCASSQNFLLALSTIDSSAGIEQAVV